MSVRLSAHDWAPSGRVGMMPDDAGHLQPGGGKAGVRETFAEQQGRDREHDYAQYQDQRHGADGEFVAGRRQADMQFRQAALEADVTVEALDLAVGEIAEGVLFDPLGRAIDRGIAAR